MARWLLHGCAVPSFLHELLVELFRNCAPLAPELLRCCTRIPMDMDAVRAELGSIDLSQVASPQYRADSVVELHGADGALRSAVIVEIQLGLDPDKRRSWPVYVTGLRARLGCSVVLLVLAPDPAVAQWARRPIDTGHPGFRLTPIVLEYADIPRIIDPRRACELPELAVLSTLAHRDLEVVQAALAAIARLPEDQNRLYSDAILTELPAELRKYLEDHMHKFEAEMAARHFAQGREVGRLDAREQAEQARAQAEQARARARALAEQARLDGLVTALRVLARGRLASLSDADAAALDALDSEARITALVDALGRAAGPREARAAFDALITAGL